MSFNECSDLLSSISFLGDSKKNFFDYVYFKISRNTQNRFVDKNNNSIEIVLDKHPCIKVIPICQEMHKDKLDIKFEMLQAIDIIKTTEFKCVYFVYPKNQNFDKHIEVKLPELEKSSIDYMVKLIPYSLTTLHKKSKCNSLCK